MEPDHLVAFPSAAVSACPKIVHGPTAALARTHLGGSAPAASCIGSGTVQDIVMRVTAALGHEVKSWATAAVWLEQQLRTRFNLTG